MDILKKIYAYMFPCGLLRVGVGQNMLQGGVGEGNIILQEQAGQNHADTNQREKRGKILYRFGMAKG